jgi:hypothetical protein
MQGMILTVYLLPPAVRRAAFFPFIWDAPAKKQRRLPF